MDKAIYRRNQEILDVNPLFTLDDLSQLMNYNMVVSLHRWSYMNRCCNPHCQSPKKQSCQKANSLLRFLNEEKTQALQVHHDSNLQIIYQMCSSCHLVRYCSKDCQTSSWNHHKSWCKETKQILEKVSKTSDEKEDL